ncbi:MAG: hypothetical protein RJA16_544, partial [Planctomycetota bacterium]
MQSTMPRRFLPRSEAPRAATPRRHGWLSVLAAFAIATAAFAAEVEFRLSSREAWVGAAITLEVEVANASSIEPPILPAVDGATIRLLPGERSSSFTQIVNGRVTRRESRVYTIEIRPTREGEIEIPPIDVRADGETFSSRPSTIVVKKSVTGDLLLAQVLADPSQVYLGESMQLVLRIVIRPYESTEFGVTLSEGDMWSRVDLDTSSWGIFKDALEEMARQRRRPLGREIEVDERRYYVYDIQASLQALRPGTPDLGDLSILMQYPTSLRQERDFFGRRQLALAGSRPLVATPEVEGIEVLPLPEDDRPAWFSGAVGDFSIRTRATPLEVSVGDPITLSIEIVDEAGDSAGLALLQPPKLEAVEALMAGFRIPAGSLAGEVDGRTKTFNQTIRPVSERVTEIPAIPFSWFDPESREYRTARSGIARVPDRVERADRDRRQADGDDEPLADRAVRRLVAEAWSRRRRERRLERGAPREPARHRRSASRSGDRPRLAGCRGRGRAARPGDRRDRIPPTSPAPARGRGPCSRQPRPTHRDQ